MTDDAMREDALGQSRGRRTAAVRTGGRRVRDRARAARSGEVGVRDTARASRAARPREGSGRAREAQARKAPGSRDAGRATRGTCDASDTRRRETPRSIAIARGRGNRYAPMVLTRRCAGQKGEAGDGRGHILGFARSCSSQFYEDGELSGKKKEHFRVPKNGPKIALKFYYFYFPNAIKILWCP